MVDEAAIEPRAVAQIQRVPGELPVHHRVEAEAKRGVRKVARLGEALAQSRAAVNQKAREAVAVTQHAFQRPGFRATMRCAAVLREGRPAEAVVVHLREGREVVVEHRVREIARLALRAALERGCEAARLRRSHEAHAGGQRSRQQCPEIAHCRGAARTVPCGGRVHPRSRKTKASLPRQKAENGSSLTRLFWREWMRVKSPPPARGGRSVSSLRETLRVGGGPR